MVINVYWSHSHRRSREQNVAHLQRHEAGNVRNERVNGEEHFLRMADLHLLAVQQQMEMDILHIRELRFGQEFAHHSGSVEGFGDFPRLALGHAFALNVTGGEIDPETDLIVVLVGELLVNTLPQPIDFHDNLCLVVNLIGKIRQEKGAIATRDGRFGFQEKNRLRRHRIMQFRRMCRIVPANTDKLHIA